MTVDQEARTGGDASPAVGGPAAPTVPASLARAMDAVRAVIGEQHDQGSLVLQIACEIGAEIIENRRRPGDDLNSVELAMRYATSRTPVREALMLLEREGLVVIRPRRRPRVASFDPREITDIYNVRAVLFSMVAEHVARQSNPVTVQALREALADMRAACADADRDAYMWANVDLYKVLTVAAGNGTARQILDTLLLRTLRLRRLSLSLDGRLEQSMANHALLVQAIADADPLLAGALIRSNHLHALAALQAHFKAQPPADLDAGDSAGESDAVDDL